MKQIFYIGCLEIAYDVDRDISFQQFDARFFRQVLPVKMSVPVNMDWVSQIELPPEGTKQFRIPDLLVCKEGDAELRFYLDGKKPIKVSSRLHDGVVDITILESCREEVLSQFRPWFNIHLERLLLKNQALVLHAASIVYQGEAILFSAPSGTGKTTQAELWKKYRDGVEDLNGDRTVLQQAGGKWYACGFPIYGSTVACAQGAYPIRGVVILRQAKVDSVREPSPIEKLSALYGECTVMYSFSEDVDAAMGLLEAFIRSVTVAELSCTMEETAVDCLHRYLYGE